MTEITNPGEEFASWTGRADREEDILSPATIARLWATLDRRDPSPTIGETLPYLAHWLYFLTAAPQSNIGHDGHEMRGHFLPAVALPRRMWASSEITYYRPLRLGARAERVSTIKSITPKKGRSGSLVFVSLEHLIHDNEGVALTETQEIVYREAARSGEAMNVERETSPADWSRSLRPDAVMLFRYSALTFNGHRIHYDRGYATTTEGYPGLIVHGPLIATLLIDHLTRSIPGIRVRTTRIRAIRPAFDGEELFLNGRRIQKSDTIELWACDENQRVIMRVSVEANN